MKSTTIASEKTHAFYVKLKHAPMVDWFVPELVQQPKFHKKKLPKDMLKHEFKITRFGYFHKHAWYFFDNDDLTGWLPLKNVRNNYRRLAVPPMVQPGDKMIDSYLMVALMMLRYAGSDVSMQQITEIFDDSLPEMPTPSDFFTIIVEYAGSFKNLSNKKLRRVRNHLRRERPIMMWLGRPHASILLTGFTKKLFFYIDPVTGQTQTMTKKQLLKRWKAEGFIAISY
ncbi:cysteine peptidase family C39 domain-containing protein [Lactobacillaceae bacterium Scapto_B20]